MDELSSGLTRWLLGASWALRVLIGVGVLVGVLSLVLIRREFEGPPLPCWIKAVGAWAAAWAVLVLATALSMGG